jgi:Tfp pilus assembly protein PilO/Tfp pilus assembly protein PilP
LADLSLARLPWHLQVAVFAALSLAVTGTYYFYLEIPTQDRIAEREHELTGIRSRISKGSITARQLPALREEVVDLRARLESLRLILPEEKDAADLLRRVHTLAVQSSLSIRGFRPQATTPRPLHAEWPIGLELEGTYHNLGAFLDRVSKFPRIINVGSLVVRGKQQPQANATVDITFTATTFVLLEGVTAAPPLPAGPSVPRAAASERDSSTDRAAAPPPNYAYEFDDRRDPFVSLANRGADSRTNRDKAVRPDGLPGVLVDEVVVRGVVVSRGTWMAIVESPNGRAYPVRPGDRLWDGSVASITADAVVLMQDVDDPLSPVKQRVVRKFLREEVR